MSAAAALLAAFIWAPGARLYEPHCGAESRNELTSRNAWKMQSANRRYRGDVALL